MKTIKVKFIDFWSGFNTLDNYIINILKEKYEVVLSDNPDYLFFSDFGRNVFSYDCIRIYITCENLCPDFNICDYGVGFEHIKYEDRYLRSPFYLHYEIYDSDLEKAATKHVFDRNEVLNSKTEFCSFVYSNKNVEGFRNAIFNALSKYRKVNSGGNAFNNIGYRVKDKIEFEKEHKFSIACDNGSHSGYTTEKIMQSFAAQTIPVYWGNPTVETDYNPKAFINCNEYSTIEEIIDIIREIDNNDDLYLKILSEPAFAPSFNIKDLKEEFKDFLFNILDQDFEKAFRRNRIFMAKLYERKLRRAKQVDDFVSIVTFRKIRKILYDWRRYGFGKNKLKL